MGIRQGQSRPQSSRSQGASVWSLKEDSLGTDIEHVKESRHREQSDPKQQNAEPRSPSTRWRPPPGQGQSGSCGSSASVLASLLMLSTVGVQNSVPITQIPLFRRQSKLTQLSQ